MQLYICLGQGSVMPGRSRAVPKVFFLETKASRSQRAALNQAKAPQNPLKSCGWQAQAAAPWLSAERWGWVPATHAKVKAERSGSQMASSHKSIQQLICS